MRFSKYLDKNMYDAYKQYYLRYEYIAKLIPEKDNYKDNTGFSKAYTESFDVVFKFIENKYDEIENKLKSIELDIINKNDVTASINDLTEEIKNFSEFIRINTTGFTKLIEKYNRKTGSELSAKYKQDIMNEIRRIEGLNKFMYSISRLKLKTTKVKQSKENGAMFIRKTNKYWIHTNNLTALKANIVKHLPIYVFKSGNVDGTPYSIWDSATHDTCISSVYFDNTKFELYNGRIKKIQGAEAIRIRWYGKEVGDVVFIERKRHEDSWTGEKSKKLRFKIYENDVVNYINGKDVWDNVKKLNRIQDNGDINKDFNENELKLLYDEVQTKIVKCRLRPMVRTFYKRNAFQLPNDSSVRISLDTNLVMIRECSDEAFINDEHPLTSWRHNDIGCEWPFINVPSKDIVRFPHGILEVKTQSMDETKPEWIEEILKGSYTEHIHKFSKYMHGCATLYKSIKDVPYWIPQMQTNILKDPFHGRYGVRRIVGKSTVYIPGESEMASSENLSPVYDHGKKIDIPNKIEPKIHLANERTFLRWMKFAVFLAGTGMTMVSIGDFDAWVCGFILVITAVIFALYGLYLYEWRRTRICSRDPGPYDDKYGPSIMVGVYLIAMVIIAGYKISVF